MNHASHASLLFHHHTDWSTHFFFFIWPWQPTNSTKTSDSSDEAWENDTSHAAKRIQDYIDWLNKGSTITGQKEGDWPVIDWQQSGLHHQ